MVPASVSPLPSSLSLPLPSSNLLSSSSGPTSPLTSAPPSSISPSSYIHPPPADTRPPSSHIDLPAWSLISYHSEERLGCSHYARSCIIHAPCCPSNTYYPCRFCHDEQSDHKIDRHSINTMICLLCAQQQQQPQHTNTKATLFQPRSQPVAATCVDCNQPMARYYCEVCKFFDDAADRDIFHCVACGICRRGKADEFFHCDTCNCCYAASLRAGHKCIENVLSSVWSAQHSAALKHSTQTVLTDWRRGG